MALIDQSYFNGELNVTNKNKPEVAGRLDFFIEKYESEFLKQLMGYELHKAFDAGIDNEELGSEQITNGSFTGSAGGWTLGAGWTYGSDKVTFTPGNVTELKRNAGAFALVIDKCRVSFNVGGSAGFVVASLGKDGTNQVFDAGSGDVTFDGTCLSTIGDIIIFTPSPDFNGSIDDVSLKEITVEQDQKWLNILNGVDYTRNGKTYRFDGLLYTRGVVPHSPIANYVWWHWTRDQVTQTVSLGEVETKSENAYPANPALKMIRAWNEMSDWVASFYNYMQEKEQRDVFPEWVSFEPKHRMLRSFMRQNTFGF